MIGTGYDASFILAVTEDVGSETTAEEDNWLAAMEWADSLGVDIINTSLGYNVMDDGIHYTYQDMDGNTTIITRAADIAASKGILCVIAAGNEGNGSWQKITAPCDADSVLCVGSVNFNRLRSSFSSMGPTADGRIKPDVMAMGGLAAVASSNLDFTYSSGTSFATPIITGLVACLWQANPTKSNMEILQAIKNSADRAYNPDTLYGWGIPNAARADSLLKGLPISNEKIKLFTIKIYPNPAKNKIYIENISLPAQIRLYDFTGKLIDEKVIFQNEYEIKPVSEGWYWLNITMDSIQNSQKIQIKD
jgi:subtilisin family serine protease